MCASVCVFIEIHLLMANVKEWHASVNFNWWMSWHSCLWWNKEVLWLSFICSNANKGWFKRGCIASREPEASRSGIHNPRKLHHTNKQIFKSKPEYFRECICTRLNKWVPKDVYILIPQICYVILTWQKGLCTHDYVKILEIERLA